MISNKYIITELKESLKEKGFDINNIEINLTNHVDITLTKNNLKLLYRNMSA